MSTYPSTRSDAGGRIWTFTYDLQIKHWTTTTNGSEVSLRGTQNGEGWVLFREGYGPLKTDRTDIGVAIDFVQNILDPNLAQQTVTTDIVRTAFARTFQTLGPEAFDRWLAAHDEELIQAVTSAATAMKETSA